jgi:hypothetical protein
MIGLPTLLDPNVKAVNVMYDPATALARVVANVNVVLDSTLPTKYTPPSAMPPPALPLTTILLPVCNPRVLATVTVVPAEVEKMFMPASGVIVLIDVIVSAVPV